MSINEWKSESYYDREANTEKYNVDLENEAPLLDTIMEYDDEMFHFIMCLLI